MDSCSESPSGLHSARLSESNSEARLVERKELQSAGGMGQKKVRELRFPTGHRTAPHTRTVATDDTRR